MKIISYTFSIVLERWTLSRLINKKFTAFLKVYCRS